MFEIKTHEGWFQVYSRLNHFVEMIHVHSWLKHNEISLMRHVHSRLKHSLNINAISLSSRSSHWIRHREWNILNGVQLCIVDPFNSQWVMKDDSFPRKSTRYLPQQYDSMCIRDWSTVKSTVRPMCIRIETQCRNQNSMLWQCQTVHSSFSHDLIQLGCNNSCVR